jgi:hypothetical protein
VFLVGTPVFKTGEGRYPVLVGSIPIRLRYRPLLDGARRDLRRCACWAPMDLALRVAAALIYIAVAPADRPGRGCPRAGCGRRRRASVPIMEQRVSLITLGVTDLAAARRFYEALGWRGQQVQETVFFQTGGSGLVLWSRENPDPPWDPQG